MEKNQIGKRMKENYEDRYRIKLTRKTPVILRLDGNCFHTLTRHCQKPFDKNFIKSMSATARHICEKISGAKCVYVQSDEISILITDFDQINTESWFDYNIQKMVSISAGHASVFFSKHYGQDGIFDARVFNIPKEEVTNYFIWRQKDWERNSLMMVARSLYSQKELHGKKRAEIHEMIHKAGQNWTDYPDILKNGLFLTRQETGWFTVVPCPIFTIDRFEIDTFLDLE